MMNKIELAKYLSQKSHFDYLNSSIDDSERKRRLAELKRKFESQSKFASFSDSGYIEDSTGIPDLDENFAVERSLAEIKRLVIRAELEKTLVPQIQVKNATTKRNAQRKLEFEKQLQKNY